jgi:hypothetical protein
MWLTRLLWLLAARLRAWLASGRRDRLPPGAPAFLPSDSELELCGVKLEGWSAGALAALPDGASEADRAHAWALADLACALRACDRTRAAQLRELYARSPCAPAPSDLRPVLERAAAYLGVPVPDGLEAEMRARGTLAAAAPRLSAALLPPARMRSRKARAAA